MIYVIVTVVNLQLNINLGINYQLEYPRRIEDIIPTWFISSTHSETDHQIQPRDLNNFERVARGNSARRQESQE